MTSIEDPNGNWRIENGTVRIRAGDTSAYEAFRLSAGSFDHAIEEFTTDAIDAAPDETAYFQGQLARLQEAHQAWIAAGSPMPI